MTPESIALRLRARMKQPKLEVGPALLDLVADWSRWERTGKSHRTSTTDWDIAFLKWALKGRCKAFVNYAEAHPSPDSEEALSGVRRMYEKHWPHNATCGPMFRFLWGWLQLELEKPGEGDLLTVAEQRDLIQEQLAKEGKRVTGWFADGFGGVLVAKTEPLDELDQVNG